jgi:peptidoglycan/LPS O-acetylase OafA/YrhL
VPLKIGLREWALVIAAACVAVSLFYSARDVLSNGGNSSSFELPLGVIASLLIVWGADERMDRTQAKWLSVAAIAVSVLLLGMLVGLPSGSLAMRLLLAAAAVVVFAGAIWKLGRL